MDWFGLIPLLAVGYALFIGVCAAHIAGRLRRPPRRTYAWALAKGLPGDPGEMRPPLAFEERAVVWREPRGGGALIGAAAGEVAIPVWVVPGEANNGLVIVLTPGWGDSRVGGLVRLSALAPMCARVILWDPPGLGASEIAGAAKRKRSPRWSMGTRDHEALAAVIDALLGGAGSPRAARAEARGSGSDADGGGAVEGRQPMAVVLFGWSAGAGASVVAAGDREMEARGRWRIAGVIAEAPYRLPWTPARNVIRAVGLPWFLCGPLAFAWLGVWLGVGPGWRGFDRATRAAALTGRVPLLVLHGVDDEVCPVEDGRAIAHTGGGAIVEIPGGRHNDLWVEPGFRSQCERAVGAFLERLALDG